MLTIEIRERLAELFTWLATESRTHPLVTTTALFALVLLMAWVPGRDVTGNK